jgi:hypothetical protein
MVGSGAPPPLGALFVLKVSIGVLESYDGGFNLTAEVLRPGQGPAWRRHSLGATTCHEATEQDL